MLHALRLLGLTENILPVTIAWFLSQVVSRNGMFYENLCDLQSQLYGLTRVSLITQESEGSTSPDFLERRWTMEVPMSACCRTKNLPQKGKVMLRSHQRTNSTNPSHGCMIILRSFLGAERPSPRKHNSVSLHYRSFERPEFQLFVGPHFLED